MQVTDFIQLYVSVVFALAAISVVVELIAIPVFDLVRRLKPTAATSIAATLYIMPKPAARKSYKDWDTMQLDAAA